MLEREKLPRVGYLTPAELRDQAMRSWFGEWSAGRFESAGHPRVFFRGGRLVFSEDDAARFDHAEAAIMEALQNGAIEAHTKRQERIPVSAWAGVDFLDVRSVFDDGTTVDGIRVFFEAATSHTILRDYVPGSPLPGCADFMKLPRWNLPTAITWIATRDADWTQAFGLLFEHPHYGVTDATVGFAKRLARLRGPSTDEDADPWQHAADELFRAAERGTLAIPGWKTGGDPLATTTDREVDRCALMEVWPERADAVGAAKPLTKDELEAWVQETVLPNWRSYAPADVKRKAHPNRDEFADIVRSLRPEVTFERGRELHKKLAPPDWRQRGRPPGR